MVRRVLVGSMLAGAACTSANPAYDPTGETSGPLPDDSDTVGGAGTTGEITQGSTRGEATDAPDPDATSSESSGSSSSSGDPPPVIDLCPLDVYAINELGELYGLDADSGGEQVLMLEDVRLRSWAIATDPSTGLLYVNERASPTTMWRVDPFAVVIDGERLEVEAEMGLEEVARATFRGDGELWIGTDQSHRFVWLPPTGGSIGGDHTLQPFPRGGDMVFLEEDPCAVVPTLDGTLYRVCFPDPGVPPPEIAVEELLGVQFNGAAVDAQGRLWLSNANPTAQLIELDPSQDPWTVVQTVDFGIIMNDLAPVVHPPGC